MKKIIFALLLCNMSFTAIADKVPESGAEKITLKQLDTLFEEVSNWGRWGDQDQLGTLNLITPEIKAKAAALVEKGVSVSLAVNFDKQKSNYNPKPFKHSAATHDSGNHVTVYDEYTVFYHGGAHTHIDALNHVTYKGKSYNGFPADETFPEAEGTLGIHNVADGIFSRGVLVDIPWLRGVDFLKRSEAITLADFKAWEAKTGITIGQGDVVLVRTGRWEHDKKFGAVFLGLGTAGLHVSVVKWLRERDIAALGSDAGNDVIPSGVEGEDIPVHLLTLVAMGMPLFDNLHLDALASQVLKSNKKEFLFIAAPIRVKGGTGGPINPLAVF